MPRRVQDIIPAKRRSIREASPTMGDVRAPVYTKAEEKKEEKEEIGHAIKLHREHIEIPESVKAVPSETHKNKRKKKSKFPWIIMILGIIIILAGLAFTISSHFSKAHFTFTPKISPITVNGTYIIPYADSGSFGYEIKTLSETASTTITATQGKYTETKAQGKVTVYNSYSKQSQRLVVGSRIEDSAGLAYRLSSTIVVPGYTVSGTLVTPGSIAATVVADKAGDEYNISSSDNISDFTFPAYKGTAKEKGFYARLSTPISGGFVGIPTVVSPNLLSSTTVAIQKSLSADLRKKLAEIIPSDYVMFDNVFGSTFGTPKVTSIDSDTAVVTADVTVYGILFKKADLARFLAGASSTNVFGSFGYDVPNIGKLAVSLANPKDFSPIKRTNLAIRVNGIFALIGHIPVDTLKKSFAGVSLSQTGDILKKYTSVIDISHSSAEITPPWVQTVPADLNRIVFSINDP